MENSQQILDAIKNRRSTRSYKPDPLDKETLKAIVEVGRYAPSANNNQTTHFIVVTDPTIMGLLCGVITSVLAGTEPREGMPPPFLALIERAKQEQIDAHYGAPALVLTANKKGYPSTIADCSCALENMMLAASALDAGSCWINLYYLLRDAPTMRSFIEGLGLHKDEDICGALVLGYPKNPETAALPRNGNPVEYDFEAPLGQ